MLPGDPGKLFTFSTIVLINCGLKELSNLEPVGDSLVHLCLSNQNITQICGLSALPQLRRLYLQQNRIAQIEGLERWEALLNNAIRSLKATGGGVSELVNLKTLNLANNRIRDVEEFEHLRKLIALRQLTFRDEHFGSNPIADHPDYRSFAITTLKQVCSPQFAYIHCATTQAS
ncbi:hypothetical protein BBJ28_00016767 [Nothophytophthora sp. Chile5]|nr:hypothetical protein BBJ28_00016767 [Nothophytophthora sp. Chile5]